MAVKVSVVRTAAVPGNKRRVVANVTCSEKYVEGGEKLTLAELGLTRAEEGDAICNIANPSEAEATSVSAAYYNPAKELLRLWAAKTGKELAKESDVSKLVVQVMVNGI